METISDIGERRALVTGNPVALAHAAVGDAWTQLILREAFYRVRRFSDWSRNLGAPRSLLASRLQRLCDLGIMELRTPPGAKRAEYRLTAMGIDLYGTALIQGQWERAHAPSPFQQRYSLTFHDVSTERPIELGVLDRPHGDLINPYDVDYIKGASLKICETPSHRRWSTQRTFADRPFLERSIDITGDYWSWSVVACAFLRIRRFDDIGEATGMAPNVLSDRLTRLVEAGVLEKRQYQDNPPRSEYRLTKAGMDLHPMVMAMHGWSERWLCDFDNPPLMLVHRESRQRITPVVCDLNTGEPISAQRVRWRMEQP